MVLHFGYLGYVALGGFLALRLPGSIVAHVAAVAWGYATIAFALPCPLTHLEEMFRQRAGQPGLGPGGFIDYYLDGVIYPERYTPLTRLLVAAVVVLSWLAVIRYRRRVMAARRSGGNARPDAHASTGR